MEERENLDDDREADELKEDEDYINLNIDNGSPWVIPHDHPIWGAEAMAKSAAEHEAREAVKRRDLKRLEKLGHVALQAVLLMALVLVGLVVLVALANIGHGGGGHYDRGYYEDEGPDFPPPIG